MSTTSTAAITFKGATRGSETADRNRNDHVRGNQGAGLDSTSSLLGSSEKRKDKKLSRKGNAVAKDANSNQWNNQKNRSRDVGGGVWSKTPSPTTTSAPIHVIATRGVSTNSSTSSNSVQHKSVESVSGEGKPSQSQPTTATTISSSSSNARGKTTGKSSSSSSARDHRSNHTPSEPGPRDPSPALSYSSSTNESSFSSSSWTKNIYSADKSVSHAPNTSGSLTLSNQKASSYEEREDYMWSTSQESDWGNEPGLDIWASTCSTDDDKISKSQVQRFSGWLGESEVEAQTLHSGIFIVIILLYRPVWIVPFFPAYYVCSFQISCGFTYSVNKRVVTWVQLTF